MALSTSGLGILPRVEITGINRTGAAVVIGGCYALDSFGADATSTTDVLAAANIVATSANNLRGFLVLALQATAANNSGRFLLKGYEYALLDATTAILKADRLVPQAASVNLIKQAAGALVNCCGVTFNALGAGVGILTQIYFNGETWKGERAAS